MAPDSLPSRATRGSAKSELITKWSAEIPPIDNTELLSQLFETSDASKASSKRSSKRNAKRRAKRDAKRKTEHEAEREAQCDAERKAKLEADRKAEAEHDSYIFKSIESVFEDLSDNDADRVTDSRTSEMSFGCKTPSAYTCLDAY